MRRVVQRAVENTVAKQMLSGTVNPGDVITISRDQVAQIFETDTKAKEIATGGSDNSPSISSAEE